MSPATAALGRCRPAAAAQSGRWPSSSPASSCWLIGENPLEALRLLIKGAFGDGEGIGFTLYYATNFIFTGLAVAVAVHAGLFNIGGEGQAYIGGLGAALVGAAARPYAPWLLMLPVAIVARCGFGAAWALHPGLAAGQARQPHRHHHHHVQFHRRGADGLSAGQRR